MRSKSDATFSIVLIMREWSCCHGLCGNLHPLIAVMDEKILEEREGDVLVHMH